MQCSRGVSGAVLSRTGPKGNTYTVGCRHGLRDRASHRDRVSHRAMSSRGVSSTPSGYCKPLDALRKDEYPHMKNGVYLDHSGATIYARSTVDGFARKLASGLYGNPHSANEPARLSGEVVDGVRERALRFLGADPRHFDLVFVANATAGIKLVADAFRDLAERSSASSFWYGYHKESHTSLVGVRELAGPDHRCFERDGDLARWIEQGGGSSETSTTESARGNSRRPNVHHRRYPATLGLLAYPGQSNLSGRRLPLSWAAALRRSPALQNTYSLLDAAALAMTSPLDRVFSDPETAPDFVCLSFYKIFGFPDLGALVVRRDSGHILTLRRYFGGGTVTMVGTVGGAWHKSKGHEVAEIAPPEDHGQRGQKEHEQKEGGHLNSKYALHDALEDGTLPFHNILALGEAIDVHRRLYGSMAAVSRHTTTLARRLYRGMAALTHPNGRPACRVYSGDGDGDDGEDAFADPLRQGATIAFNVLRPDGSYVPYSDVEKMANDRHIYIRSGGICCPGGLFAALQYEPWELDRVRSAGHHCGSDGLSLVHQLPTGVVRASLGAMSTPQDVDTFLSFLREVFVTRESTSFSSSADPITTTPDNNVDGLASGSPPAYSFG